MRSITLLSSLLAASATAAAWNPSPRAELTCSGSHAKILQITKHVKHSTNFCTYFLESARKGSPLPAIDATGLSYACECILQNAGKAIPSANSAKSVRVPSISSVTCDVKYGVAIQQEFTYPKAFCRYATTLTKSSSPVHDLTVVEVIQGCKCVLQESLTTTGSNAAMTPSAAKSSSKEKGKSTATSTTKLQTTSKFRTTSTSKSKTASVSESSTKSTTALLTTTHSLPVVVTTASSTTSLMTSPATTFSAISTTIATTITPAPTTTTTAASSTITTTTTSAQIPLWSNFAIQVMNSGSNLYNNTYLQLSSSGSNDICTNYKAEIEFATTFTLDPNLGLLVESTENTLDNPNPGFAVAITSSDSIAAEWLNQTADNTMYLAQCKLGPQDASIKCKDVVSNPIYWAIKTTDNDKLYFNPSIPPPNVGLDIVSLYAVPFS